MKHQNDQLASLQDIRSMMERSTKFVSLSGLSGISIGVIALIGATIAYAFLLDDAGRNYFDPVHGTTGPLESETIIFLLMDAFAVLFLSFTVGYYFTGRKAQKFKQKLLEGVAKRMLGNMLIPLLTGGLICTIFLFYGMVFMLAPLTLIFYGLALLNGSYYTLGEIKYLGISEIILGLVSLLFLGYGLLFWAIGFGVLHIAYGIYMYNKYDRVPDLIIAKL